MANLTSTNQRGDSEHLDMIWIPGETFLMGSEDQKAMNAQNKI